MYCSVSNVKFKVWSVKCGFTAVKCEVYSVECVDCRVYSVECGAHCACTVCGAIYGMQCVKCKVKNLERRHADVGVAATAAELSPRPKCLWMRRWGREGEGW